MPSLEIRYTGAPEQRAAFDDLTDRLHHQSLPEFAGTAEGDSTRVEVKLSDPLKNVQWEGAGHPHELSARFDDWLKEIYEITPRFP